MGVIEQGSRDAQPAPWPTAERELRQYLGIPDAAEHVLFLAESSHWDPNWLQTSDEYFERLVRPNLDRAISELIHEPRRIYSVECLFFLRKYWDARPDRRETIRELINSRRLRLTSSGVTTADTLLPKSEAILRDLLLGQEWLRSQDMTQQPELAYFPDSFGHSPCLPSLLNAAGFSQAGITRVDGMFFPGCDFEFPSRFQWEGSSAALLMKKERTLDFVWRDSEGGQVLCHWNAFTYGQGDLLAYTGLSRVYLAPLAFSNRSDWNVTRRIHQYVRQLVPYARTPYLFCPIGLDFVDPIPDLVSLLDRYNAKHYPQTGIWVVNAGMDDYLSLVAHYRQYLPILNLDPNPYWSGFYTARPTLKKQCHDLVDTLVLAEGLGVLPENELAGKTAGKEMETAWWNAAASNHHDFITGTATDRVVGAEQQPWLARGVEIASAAVAGLKRRGPILSPPRVEIPSWRLQDGCLQVDTPYGHFELAEEAGGCITHAWEPETNLPLLTDYSNDLIAYSDSGGLWRMGHEFRGGHWEEITRTSARPARLQVRERPDSLEVVCAADLAGMHFTRRLWFRADRPDITFQVEGRAAEQRTITLNYASATESDHLVMDVPGGVVRRPTVKKYDPTFWSLSSFVHLQENGSGHGLAILLQAPGAVAYRSGGALEVITHRNAVRERAWRIIPLPGMPVTGHERQIHTATGAILLTPSGDWLANELLLQARRISRGASNDGTRWHELTASLIHVDRQGVQIDAIKRASCGDGLIIRLTAPGQRGQPVVLSFLQHQVSAAYLCDARERDLQPLRVERRCQVHITLPGSIATVRALT